MRREIFTPFAFLISRWVKEDIVSPLLLSPLMDISDGKEFGFVFHKELVVENPADVSIEPKTLGGAVEMISNFFSQFFFAALAVT